MKLKYLHRKNNNNKIVGYSMQLSYIVNANIRKHGNQLSPAVSNKIYYGLEQPLLVMFNNVILDLLGEP
jgi:hypothetical protein